MKKLLTVVVLFSFSGMAYAGMDKSGNPTLDPQNPQYTQGSQEIDSKNDTSGIALLGEVLKYMKTMYYKEVNFSECIPGLLKGGISECMDRYSYYLDPIQAKEENDTFTVGKLAGIGTTLEVNKEGGVKILDVIEGSPAEKAGLKEGDVILAVSSNPGKTPENWIDLEKMPIDQVVKLIRGPKGTVVNLLVLHDGKRQKFSITRDTVKIKFLSSKIINGKIGYIRVKEFGGDVSEQFYDAMLKFDSYGLQSVIIDLRSNGGGKLSSALDMCSWFAKTDKYYATILYAKDREGPAKDMTVGNRNVGKFKNKTVFVLQNGNSASASEIFAGYLKYETGAIVIGEKSYGKGIMQTLIPLSNRGELHITTAEYFIGKNVVKVHGIGIPPDIEVKQTKPVKIEQDDDQLQRAVQESEKLLDSKLPK